MVEPVSPYNLSDVEKKGNTNILDSPTYDDDGEIHYTTPAQTARDLVTEVIHARDDPTLNPWTFRVWFLGECNVLQITMWLLISSRHWFGDIRRYPRHDLLF